MHVLYKLRDLTPDGGKPIAPTSSTNPDSNMNLQLQHLPGSCGVKDSAPSYVDEKNDADARHERRLLIEQGNVFQSESLNAIEKGVLLEPATAADSTHHHDHHHSSSPHKTLSTLFSPPSSHSRSLLSATSTDKRYIELLIANDATRYKSCTGGRDLF
jgi:hypothetical protein